MKRASQGGCSPDPKHSPFRDQVSDEDFDFLENSQSFSFMEKSQPYSDSDSFGFLPSPPQATLHLLSQASSDQQLVTTPGIFDTLSDSECSFSWAPPPSSPDNFSPDAIVDEPTDSKGRVDIQELVAVLGVSELASVILEHEALKEEIMQKIFDSSHKSLKTEIKKSKLTSDKKDRAYLLTLTPRDLCEEFKAMSGSSFRLLVHGLLGITESSQVFESQFLLNNICLIYSTVGKILNRNATGYALLLTTTARDGGLREDSIKLLACLLHPRTSQKYDRSILADGWDTKLNDNLKKEKAHFKAQKEAEYMIEELLQNDSTDEAINRAKDELDTLLDTSPPQMQLVWDNLNLRTNHRYQRVGDEYADSNLDWMASLWLKDRISANHMQHEGESLKLVDNLNIRDFVPTEKEKDYVFRSLINYFSHRLVQRHPLLFQSIARCIMPNRPHQFQDAMDSKSEEFTGNLFTLSESRTEDLITMMSEVQLNVHTFNDNNGVEHCHERKIVAGDNKTEKNMTYGILRFVV